MHVIFSQKRHPIRSWPPRNVKSNDLLIYHSSYSYNTSPTLLRFLKLSMVRILSNEVVHTKKATFEGAFIFQILFQGNKAVPGLVRTW